NCSCILWGRPNPTSKEDWPMSNAAAVSPKDSVSRRHGPFLYLYHVGVIIELEIMKVLKDPTEILSRSLQPVIWLLLFGEAFSRMKAVPEAGGDRSEEHTSELQ